MSTKSTKSIKTNKTIHRPLRGVTAQLWDIFDNTKPADSAAVRAMAEENGFNVRLARSHYRQWKAMAATKKNAGTAKPKTAGSAVTEKAARVRKQAS